MTPQPEDATVPIWEARVLPTLPEPERRALAWNHVRCDYYDTEDAEMLRRETPICLGCGEVWADFYGCTTLRALALLALVEHQLSEAVMERDDAQRGLAQMGARGDFDRRQDERRYQIVFSIDEMALIHGGPRTIAYGLEHIGREMSRKYEELKPRNG